MRDRNHAAFVIDHDVNVHSGFDVTKQTPHVMLDVLAPSLVEVQVLGPLGLT